jgi:hypothetical protein
MIIYFEIKEFLDIFYFKLFVMSHLKIYNILINITHIDFRHIL